MATTNTLSKSAATVGTTTIVKIMISVYGVARKVTISLFMVTALRFVINNAQTLSTTTKVTLFVIPPVGITNRIMSRTAVCAILTVRAPATITTRPTIRSVWTPVPKTSRTQRKTSTCATHNVR